MARQILPIAGQIIGGMIGGPVGAAIGGAIGGAIGQYVDPIRHQGPKLGEARAQTAQEGVYRPLVFGTGCVAGNVIHRSPRKVVRHRERVGKGNRDTVDSDRGYRTFAIRIAEAHTPDGYALLRIWENETLVYDVRPESEIVAESEEYAEKFRFYAGTQDQLPDPDLEAYLGVGNVNSYRGSCYIVFGNFDLTDYGDMVPQYRFEVSSVGGGLRMVSLAIGERDSGSVSRIATNSTDGESWEVVSTGGAPSAQYISSVGNRFVIWTIHSARFTTDAGASWSGPRGSFGGVGIGRSSYTRTNTLLIPGANQGLIYRTDDGGESFRSHSTPGGAWTRACATRDGLSIAVGQSSNNALVSLDDGTTWSVGGEHGVYIHADMFASCSDKTFIVGGMSSNIGSKPTLSRSAAGSVWQTSTLSASSGFTIYFVVPGDDDDWVAVTDNGELWYSHDDGNTWQKSDDVLPVTGFGNTPSGLAWNGNAFIASSAGGSAGVIIYSRDRGVTWDVSTQPINNGIELLAAGVSSIAPSDSDGVELSAVVGFCHRRVGMEVADYDISELTDRLDGVVFADGYTARDAITTLLPIYNADASEHDRGGGYRINYVKRGAPVVRTLTVDDLVDEPEETVREDPMERPRVLHMAFESPITGYTAGKASIQRLSPDVKLVNEVSTYVPVTFKDVDEAWQRADVQMRVAWTEVHGERKFSIPDSHIDLVPTDNVALSLRGQVQRLRLLKNEYVDGVLKLESVADRQSNYTSHVTGIPLPAPEKPPPSLMGPAALAILDIPAISDQHDRLGYYVAVTGTADAFAGAVVQRQQNGQWSDVVSIGRSQRATIGVLENAVSAGSEHYTDTTNTVSVTLYMDAELESLSNEQWLNKGGAFALETATGWEIMQYRDAYQDSGGVWHLSHLARGRLNTVADEHQPGARFVLLDGVRFIEADVGMIGEDLTLRAAAVGRSPETAVPETITYQGNSQREFPVASLTAELDGSTLELAAIPRDRFGTEQHPVRSANHDGFRWSATDGSATVTTDTDHATATLDVSGLSTPITVTVAQLNRFTGAGPTVSESVE